MTLSGDCRISWLKPDVVRLPPAGRALTEDVFDEEESSGAGDALGERRALMFILSSEHDGYALDISSGKSQGQGLGELGIWTLRHQEMRLWNSRVTARRVVGDNGKARYTGGEYRGRITSVCIGTVALDSKENFS